MHLDLVRARGLCFRSAPTPAMLNPYLTHYRRALSPALQKEGVQIFSPLILTAQVQRYFSQRASERTTFNRNCLWGPRLLPLCTLVIWSVYLDNRQCNMLSSRREAVWGIDISSKTSAGKAWSTKMQKSQTLSLALAGPPSLTRNIPKWMIDNFPVNSSTSWICCCWWSPWAKDASEHHLFKIPTRWINMGSVRKLTCPSCAIFYRRRHHPVVFTLCLLMLTSCNPDPTTIHDKCFWSFHYGGGFSYIQENMI